MVPPDIPGTRFARPMRIPPKMQRIEAAGPRGFSEPEEGPEVIVADSLSLIVLLVFGRYSVEILHDWPINRSRHSCFNALRKDPCS
jgi:hypothetical protein